MLHIMWQVTEWWNTYLQMVSHSYRFHSSSDCNRTI